MSRTEAASFSIHALRAVNPALARSMCWEYADWDRVDVSERRVQIGCGENVLPDFVNLDMLPVDERVVACNLLDIWPGRLATAAKGFYSEDVLEHFFLGEQLYLLCSMNLLSRPGSVSRVLMPDIDKLWTYRQGFDAGRMQRDNDYFHTVMGCADAIQVINTGMRMGGHRWLHNQESFAGLARLAGFEAHPASCHASRDPAYDGINLRSEHAVAFATDLVKVRDIRRHVLAPSRILGAKLVEEVDAAQSLWRSTGNDPLIAYEFPGMPWEDLTLVNVRCANLSEYNEHNFSKMYFAQNEANTMYTDRTMQSACYMNTFTKWDIDRKRPRDSDTVSFLRFDPSERPGDYFTAGPIEIFTMP